MFNLVWRNINLKGKFIFILSREGLEWTDIDWNDNGECLDLVEKVGKVKYAYISLIEYPIFKAPFD